MSSTRFSDSEIDSIDLSSTAQKLPDESSSLNLDDSSLSIEPSLPNFTADASELGQSSWSFPSTETDFSIESGLPSMDQSSLADHFRLPPSPVLSLESSFYPSDPNESSSSQPSLQDSAGSNSHLPFNVQENSSIEQSESVVDHTPRADQSKRRHEEIDVDADSKSPNKRPKLEPTEQKTATRQFIEIDIDAADDKIETPAKDSKSSAIEQKTATRPFIEFDEKDDKELMSYKLKINEMLLCAREYTNYFLQNEASLFRQKESLNKAKKKYADWYARLKPTHIGYQAANTCLNHIVIAYQAVTSVNPEIMLARENYLKKMLPILKSITATLSQPQENYRPIAVDPLPECILRAHKNINDILSLTGENPIKKPTPRIIINETDKPKDANFKKCINEILNCHEELEEHILKGWKKLIQPKKLLNDARMRYAVSLRSLEKTHYAYKIINICVHKIDIAYHVVTVDNQQQIMDKKNDYFETMIPALINAVTLSEGADIRDDEIIGDTFPDFAYAYLKSRFYVDIFTLTGCSTELRRPNPKKTKTSDKGSVLSSSSLFHSSSGPQASPSASASQEESLSFANPKAAYGQAMEIENMARKEYKEAKEALAQSTRRFNEASASLAAAVTDSERALQRCYQRAIPGPLQSNASASVAGNPPLRLFDASTLVEPQQAVSLNQPIVSSHSHSHQRNP